MFVFGIEFSRALCSNEHVVCELSIDGVRLGFWIRDPVPICVILGFVL